MQDPKPNPMDHPPEQPSGTDDSPRFGRLLVVLVLAVLIVGGLALFAERMVS